METKKHITEKSAFTIVELLVAMSIFTIVIVLVVGIFIQGLRSQRILNHLMAINDNTALVIEQAAREMRTGYDFCPPDADPACSPTLMNFVNFRGERVIYSFEMAGIARNGIVLTTPEALITDAGFILSQNDSDANPDDNACNPWRTSIFMTVNSSDPEIQQVSRIQTTVTSRVLPIDSPNADQALINQCSVN